MKSRLEISDSTLICRDDAGQAGWMSNIDDLILIAEYTTDEGPWIDDYFFVFVTSEKGAAYFSKCTFYAAGVNEVLTELSLRLEFPLKPGLCGSMTCLSRVMWPAQLENTQYFEFTEVATESLWSKLRKSVLGAQLEYTISDPVREYIRRTTRARVSAEIENSTDEPEGQVIQ